MKDLEIEIKDCIGNNNDFYVILNDKKLNLFKTPQGKKGTIKVDDGDNILIIKKKYKLDNKFGSLGVIFLWIRDLLSGNIGENITDDGRYSYEFKMKFNLKSDSKAKFYIVDKQNQLVNPISYEIFQSTEYEILENKSIENNRLPMNYGLCMLLKCLFGVAMACGFILLFIH